jgi:hypothetical protein
VKDSSLLASLAAGTAYSVVTSGVGETTGIGLVEVYDLDEPSSTARLVNISARAVVGTGENILIPGFVIDGNVSLTLLIRGVGPRLADFGIPTGFLADPIMTVVRKVGSDNVEFASNDDWEDNPDVAALTAISNTVGAFPLLAGGRDAAILVSLAPGIYTVKVEGKDGTTGIGLVEVYVIGN